MSQFCGTAFDQASYAVLNVSVSVVHIMQMLSNSLWHVIVCAWYFVVSRACVLGLYARLKVCVVMMCYLSTCHVWHSACLC